LALVRARRTVASPVALDERQPAGRGREPAAMEESGLRGATRTAVGSTLAGPNGVLCMRTACQDIVPKCLSGACREAARGGNARELCRPRLVECQQDSAGIVGCAERCARYFGAADMPDCTRDCNRVRCREYEVRGATRARTHNLMARR
jgi:hypothetical protein